MDHSRDRTQIIANTFDQIADLFNTSKIARIVTKAKLLRLEAGQVPGQFIRWIRRSGRKRRPSNQRQACPGGSAQARHTRP